MSTTMSDVATIETLQPPWVDADGLLRRDGQWVALGPIEGRLVDLLCQRFGLLVSREDLERAGWGHAPEGRALDLQLMRVRRRVAALGLTLRNVRARGYVLGFAPSAGRLVSYSTGVAADL